jgi:hypothetical protein
LEEYTAFFKGGGGVYEPLDCAFGFLKLARHYEQNKAGFLDVAFSIIPALDKISRV